MGAMEDLNKAYTAGSTAVGTNWAGSAAAGSQRAQLGSPSAEVNLTDAQRTYLMDRVINEATLLGMIRRYTMKRSRVELPRISVGTSLMRASHAGGHHESTTAGTRVAPDSSSVILTSSKLTLPWTVSEDFLEDNVEQGAAEQLIADMMGIQAANDLENLSVNGDETGGDPLLFANNGFISLGASGNVYDFAGAAVTFDAYDRMIRTMPTKYRARDKTKIKFFVPISMELDTVNANAARIGDRADRFLTDGTRVSNIQYGGYDIVPIKYLPENGNVLGGNNEYSCFFTDPDNLIFGVERDMKLRKTADGKNALDFDERYYALYIRCDFQIQNTEAFVLGKKLLPRVAG